MVALIMMNKKLEGQICITVHSYSTKGETQQVITMGYLKT